MAAVRKYSEKERGPNELRLSSGRVVKAVYYGPQEPSSNKGGRIVDEFRLSCGRVVKAVCYGPKDPSSKREPRSKRMCYKCDACNLKVDCGKCDFCLDQRRFGGKNRLRQKCRLKQCSLFSRSARTNLNNHLNLVEGKKNLELDILPQLQSKHRNKRMCFNCDGCNMLVDCGECDFCLDRRKFGGKNYLHQKCRLKQCRLFSKFVSPELRCGPQDALKKILLRSFQTNPLMPSKAINTPSEHTPQRLHPHWATRSRNEVDERTQRQRENDRRWQIKQKQRLWCRQTKQWMPRKDSRPCLKIQPQVVLNGKFKLKHLQVGGQRITFRDLFVKVHNLMESMKDQNLNRKARYLQIGGQRIRIRDPFVKLHKLKTTRKDQTLNKETSQAPPLIIDDTQEVEEPHPDYSESFTVTSQAPPPPLIIDDTQEVEEPHPDYSESFAVNPEAIPLPPRTDISQEDEGPHPVESDSETLAPDGGPLPLSTELLEGIESNPEVDSESITMAPMCDPLEGERLLPEASECMAMAPMCEPLEGERLLPEASECMAMVTTSYPFPLSRNPLQGKGSNLVDREGMIMIKSKSLVLVTIFYKKMEIRKRKYKIFTIKELIEICMKELKYYIQGNHDVLERIQIYDTDFSEYVDFDINTDDVKDKDRFLVYFGESKCQCTDCMNCSRVQITESSNVYPSKPRLPPPSDIDDYLIQGKEDTERDSAMPVIMEIVSLNSCLAVSRMPHQVIGELE